ncbi:chemoreceptor glutamine deamidase CheD [Frateuria aurantia]
MNPGGASSAREVAEPALVRFFDPGLGRTVIKLQPGQCYVSDHAGEVISTLLGSCIAVCAFDQDRRLGGMNHFMLPGANQGQRWGEAGRAARYGVDAMEHLLNDLFKAGAQRDRLQVKLFGGARVIAGRLLVGERNISFAHHYLALERLQIVAEDVGEHYARHIRFFPDTGRVQVRRLSMIQKPDVIEDEQAYGARLMSDPLQGQIELFHS